MNIKSVMYMEDPDGGIDAFLVNGDTMVMNGEDMPNVLEVRGWLESKNMYVPEYSSVRIEETL